MPFRDFFVESGRAHLYADKPMAASARRSEVHPKLGHSACSYVNQVCEDDTILYILHSNVALKNQYNRENRR